MQVYVVIKEDKGKEGKGRKVWVFSTHKDALECRQLNNLTSHDLYGCSIDCYDFKEKQ